MLIISNNANNRASETITIIPITSDTIKIHPFQVFLDSKETGLIKGYKSQCHQIRTISRLRIKDNKPIGQVTKSLNKICAALTLHLDL